ncbi:Endonuclease -like protein [Talaromyces atroroseus]|uniref:Endonuclease III homolog n=1 Tax=Talaromyces atroroseus TaxID=1441469 RepID=A0A1Q5QBR9_TALAT|nr:Endonuclease -like protein [Talaromyces atroroseus]OKL63356.1 Endonuclease -like protein [Talaromyces atroroseus]
MRTSRISRDTANVVGSLSRQTRQTRNSSASGFSSFTYTQPIEVSQSISVNYSSNVVFSQDDRSSSLSSVHAEDIEDLLEPPAKRRRRSQVPATRRARNETATPIKAEVPAIKLERSSNTRQRRQPARKIKQEDGSVQVQPPSNWETMYELVKKMRAANPTAPVDTMGCAELHWKSSPPKDQRFQTLIALMLSSQTKDTVTAVAMHRLHTELGERGEEINPSIKKEESFIKKEEEEEGDEVFTAKKKCSTLTLENILAVSSERLNELICKVGFHNNKTKYIKQAAVILRDQYDSDIPSTAEDLMKLPGVGPKMAYLCMSAAWGKHDGIGVDVHVHRITNMWGWHSTKNPEETRIALQSWLPKDKWHEINKLLVGLGQTACLPVARRCGECDLAGTGLCKSEIKGSLVQMKKEKKEEEARVKIEAP